MALEDRVTPTLTPQMVLDINATELGWIRSEIVAVGSVAYFAAVDGIWKSDGTTAGTVLIKDIYPGSGATSPSRLTNVNGTVYFTADDGTHGLELWKSDGTAAGTVMVKDINPGSAGSYFHGLTAVNGTLFFSVNDGTIGDELWKSDGTVALP